LAIDTPTPRFPVYFRDVDLPAAYAFAAQREARASPSEGHTQVESLGSKREVFSGWTAAQVERAYLESPPGMKLIFDGMIERPETVLTSEDLAGFLVPRKPHADAVTVRGTMGAFANRCGIRYGRGKKDFPFRHWYVEGGFARYLMPREVAETLRAVRDQDAR
jgi:hypothetical protein